MDDEQVRAAAIREGLTVAEVTEKLKSPRIHMQKRESGAYEYDIVGTYADMIELLSKIVCRMVSRGMDADVVSIAVADGIVSAQERRR